MQLTMRGACLDAAVPCGTCPVAVVTLPNQAVAGLLDALARLDTVASG